LQPTSKACCIKGQDFSLTTTTLQEQPVPTLEELVNRLPSPRDIPSLSKDKAKQSLLKERKLLNAMVVAFQNLHNWSLHLNFEARAVMEQSKLSDDVHNKQVEELTEMLGKITYLNWEPFRAILMQTADNFEEIERIDWQINFTLRKTGNTRKIAYLST